MTNEFLQVARPVLFESADRNWPYWGRGSSFIVSMGEHCFFVSARHVIDNQGGSVDALRVFPSDGSRMSIPFNCLVQITLDGKDDEIYKDLFIAKVDVDLFRRSGDANMHTLALDKGCARLDDVSQNDKMLIIGFPSEIRGVDYESCKISYCRKLLQASFQCASQMDHCYTVKLRDAGGLEDLDGFSGSPVFNIKDGDVPRIAGVMIRGSVASGICHFIGVHVLEAAIRKALAS